MKQPDLYLAPLDGLRFFAFLAVFIHHFSPFGSTVMIQLNRYGWSGVELFFLISSFLFFHLLSAEYDKTGTVDARRFFIRRILRIYPLMMAFPIAMYLIYGGSDGTALVRLAGLALFVDNLLTGIVAWNVVIPKIPHLWSLSFEFQIYLIIPFVFLAYKRSGTRAFMIWMAGVLAYCLLLRMTFYAAGAKHPVVWVTPFLRPESVIAGMVLYVLKPTWPWWWSAIGSLMAGILFFTVPPPWESGLGMLLSFPLAALMFAGLVDASLRGRHLSAALSVPPLRMLGRISFGLYVFHVLAISLAPQLTPPTGRAGLFLSTLLLTIAMAAVSYCGMEYWVDRFKRRFAVVEGRV